MTEKRCTFCGGTGHSATQCPWRKGQSKLDSLVEAITNVLVGIVVALLINLVLMRFLGIPASPLQSLGLVLGHTVFSLIRQYVIRRCFNKLTSSRA